VYSKQKGGAIPRSALLALTPEINYLRVRLFDALRLSQSNPNAMTAPQRMIFNSMDRSPPFEVLHLLVRRVLGGEGLH